MFVGYKDIYSEEDLSKMDDSDRSICESENSERFENYLKTKSSWFCGVTRSLNDMDHILRNINEFFYYAYIIHDKDDTGTHIHWIGNVAGSRSIKSISNMLDIDPHFIQPVSRVKGFQRYMLHLDSSDKHLYDISEVCSNDIDRYRDFVLQRNISVSDQFKDYLRVSRGDLTVFDYIDLYSAEFAKMNFYQKVKVFYDLQKLC